MLHGRIIAMKRIGVIGLGTMGLPMSLNLVKAGFEVRVFNRTAAKAQPVVRAGGKLCASVAELVGTSEVVLLMLANDAVVKEIVLGNDGVAASGKPGLLVIDSSTVSPTTTRQTATALATKGIRHLDAPVTGSKKQAEEGSLSFLVGGDRALFESCAPIFAAMGKKTFYLGETGMGSSAKLCNNMTGAMNMAALSESLTLAVKCGIDPRTMLDILATSGARSAMGETKGPKIVMKDFSTAFALALMSKDVGLALQLARETNHDTPLLATTKEVYDQAVKAVDADADFSILHEWYAKR